MIGVADVVEVLGSAPVGALGLALVWGEVRLLPAVRAVVRLEVESQGVLVGIGKRAGVDVAPLEAAIADARRAVPT